ncbi:hypothetical protein PUMCH_000386 [Australozyma saopauloensis]|uniref:Peptidase A1 domain-containing protein n=1 Tax=Australozyma saopauloensis TaxID=291208 RepID=A0AAX4H4A8_9ASCO|nr:hypothetical protein PUMCH_000386 [[Candida] saopauloensis]
MLFSAFLPAVVAASFMASVTSQEKSLITQASLVRLEPTTTETPLTILGTVSGIVSIPISMSTVELFYNAYFTDTSGKVVGGRLDLLQPNVWLLNGEINADCQSVGSFLSSLSRVLATEVPSYLTYNNSTYGLDNCFSNGAIYPNTVITTTMGSMNATITTLLYSVVQTLTLSYGMVNYATGPYVKGNLTIQASNGTDIELNDFEFLIANNATRVTGALGLANSLRGEGLLDYLIAKGQVGGNGYSIFFGPHQNETDGTGIVLLGGVSEAFMSGPLYSFPRVPHTLSNSLLFPIVVLELVWMINLANDELISLYSDDPFGVLFESRLRYSFFPINLILNLAVQMNAVYSNQFKRWIVRCQDIWNTDAELRFKIGPLTIAVPLQSMLMKTELFKYTDGGEACYVTVLPTSFQGYSALGLNVMSHVYMAMDNEKGNIALANPNPNVYFVDSQPVLNSSYLDSNSTGMARIVNGNIPFAVLVTLQPQVVFTFSTANASLEANIPARFSGSFLMSDSLLISDNIQSTMSYSAVSSVRTKTMSGLGLSFTVPNQTALLCYVLLATIGFLGIAAL